MKYINATRKTKGEEQTYIKAVPESAIDCYELFVGNIPVSKKEMDNAHATLRASLERFFAKSAHVSADYLNHAISDSSDFERVRSAHQVNAVKAYNDIQHIIFGKEAICIDILDMHTVKAFCDSFAVLFRGRFAKSAVSALANKEFTVSSFRECCELFAAFENVRRNGERFVSTAIKAEIKNDKVTKNARKRAMRAAAAKSPEYTNVIFDEARIINETISEAVEKECNDAISEASSIRMGARLSEANKNAIAAAV